MLPLISIFCMIDDFCKCFEQKSKGMMLENPSRKRNRACKMHLSEVMTIIVLFHLSHYKTFKDFYIHCINENYRKEFPTLLSYNRFVEVMHQAFMPLFVLIHTLKGKKTGKYCIDSTKLPVCHNLRINRHKVFRKIAQRGKTSTRWFFGFKLHIVINDRAELMNFILTPGNEHDTKVVETLSQKLKGWLFGDRGYFSKDLRGRLKHQGLELITTLKNNMKKHVLEPLQKHYLKQRGIIETVINQLKNMMTINHTRA